MREDTTQERIIDESKYLNCYQRGVTLNEEGY